MQVIAQSPVTTVVLCMPFVLLVLGVLIGPGSGQVPTIAIMLCPIGLVASLWYVVNFLIRRRNRAIVGPDGITFVVRGTLKENLRWSDIKEIRADFLGAPTLVRSKDGTFVSLGDGFFGSSGRARQFLNAAQQCFDEWRADRFS